MDCSPNFANIGKSITVLHRLCNTIFVKDFETIHRNMPLGEWAIISIVQR